MSTPVINIEITELDGSKSLFSMTANDGEMGMVKLDNGDVVYASAYNGSITNVCRVKDIHISVEEREDDAFMHEEWT